MRYFLLLLALSIIRIGFAVQDSTIVRFENALQRAFPSGLDTKLFMHLNRSEFIAGDTVFFSVYALDADGTQPLAGREIVNVVLIGHDNENVLNQKLLVTDGFGKNQLILPSNLGAGRYGIIASPERSNRFMAFRTIIDVVNENQLTTPPQRKAQVWAEGNRFVAGVTNKLVATGPPLTNANVVSNNDKIETNISFNRDGISVFYLNPKEGTKYGVRVANGLLIPIPDVTTSSLSMMLTKGSEKESLLFAFRSSPKNGIKGSNVFVVYRYGQIYFKANLSFERKDQLLVPIKMTGLPFGVYQAAVFDSNGSVLTERAFYFGNDGDCASATINVENVKTQYNVREKARVNLSGVGEPIVLPVSVSIYNKAIFKNRISADRDYLRIQADILEPIPDSLKVDAINDYLITCTSIFSTNVLDKILPRSDKHYPGHLVLKGSIVDSEGKPAELDSLRISFFVQNDIAGYSTWAHRKSRFTVPLLINFYGSDRVLYTIEQAGKKLDDLRLIPDTQDDVYLPFDLTSRDSGKKHPLSEAALQRRAFAKAFEVRKSANIASSQILNPHALIEEETIGVDASVRLSDYLIFPTMEETLREVVSNVQHRWVDRKHRVRVWLEEIDLFADGEPLYFIDGVATDDTDYFMSLNPANVQVIKIINSFDKLQVFGPAGRFGVILVETNIPNNATNVPSEHIFNATGLTAPLAFKNQINAFPPRIPDTRYLLYWNPEVLIDQHKNISIDFLTSDLTGEYVIAVSGVTVNGCVIQHEQAFQVVYEDEAN